MLRTRLSSFLTRSNHLRFCLGCRHYHNFSLLPENKSSQNLPQKSCPYHSKISSFIKTYQPNFPEKFQSRESTLEKPLNFRTSSSNTHTNLNLQNYHQIFFISVNNYCVNILPFKKLTTVDENNQKIAIWQHDTTKTEVFLPLNSMDRYIKKTRGINKGHRNLSLFEDLKNYFDKKLVSLEDSNTAIVYQYYGDHYHRKISTDELKMLQKEKADMKKAGVDALRMKMRNSEEILMASGTNHITRASSRLKHTKYTASVNRLYANDSDSNKKNLIPSEYIRVHENTTNEKTGAEDNFRKMLLKYLENIDKLSEKVEFQLEKAAKGLNLDIFKTTQPDLIAHQIDPNLAKIFYRLDHPDSVESSVFREMLINMLYQAKMMRINSIMTKPGELDSYSSLVNAGEVVKETLSSNALMAYNLIDYHEKSRDLPYRSFYDVYWRCNHDIYNFLQEHYKFDFSNKIIGTNSNNENEIGNHFKIYGGTTLINKNIKNLKSSLDHQKFYQNLKLYNAIASPEQKILDPVSLVRKVTNFYPEGNNLKKVTATKSPLEKASVSEFLNVKAASLSKNDLIKTPHAEILQEKHELDKILNAASSNTKNRANLSSTQNQLLINSHLLAQKNENVENPNFFSLWDISPADVYNFIEKVQIINLIYDTELKIKFFTFNDPKTKIICYVFDATMAEYFDLEFESSVTGWVG